jgi:hypothetical protein
MVLYKISSFERNILSYYIHIDNLDILIRQVKASISDFFSNLQRVFTFNVRAFNFIEILLKIIEDS